MMQKSTWKNFKHLRYATSKRLSFYSDGRSQTRSYREWLVRMSTWIKTYKTFSDFPEYLDSDAIIETDSYSYEWFAASWKLEAVDCVPDKVNWASSLGETT